MKILISCSKVKYLLGMSFARSFQKLSIETELFFDDEAYEESFRVFKNKYTHRLFWKFFSVLVREKFFNSIKKSNPDLILIFKGAYYSPEFLKSIKDKWPAIPLFCYAPDNVFDTKYYGVSNKWIRRSIPIYDAYFIWGKFLIGKLLDFGAKRAEYIPFGYDPDIHYPVKATVEEKKYYGSDVAFIGSWDKEREQLLNRVADYDLKIWGDSWAKANPQLKKKWQGRAVFGEELAKVCDSSKIILDILRPHMLPAHTMKIFEISGCKGFLLSSRGGEFGDFFDEGEEIATFENPEEMLSKLNFFLKHDELRAKIAEAAHKKVGRYEYVNSAKKIIATYQELTAGRV
ncbi:MAG: glycosyltransferase [bacterium]|nr:glycosyltransferase [bacterium]